MCTPTLGEAACLIRAGTTVVDLQVSPAGEQTPCVEIEAVRDGPVVRCEQPWALRRRSRSGRFSDKQWCHMSDREGKNVLTLGRSTCLDRARMGNLEKGSELGSSYFVHLLGCRTHYDEGAIECYSSSSKREWGCQAYPSHFSLRKSLRYLRSLSRGGPLHGDTIFAPSLAH